MSRVAKTANYLGGVILALGVLWVGLSMPKPGWHALNERLPEWLNNFETGGFVALFGVVMIAIGKVLGRRSSMPPTEHESLIGVSSSAQPKVWCMGYPGHGDLLAAYNGAENTSEARKKRMQTSARNRHGLPLEAEDFSLVLHAMDDPPDALQDYCYISGGNPMVSPRLAEVLKGLDLGNGAFFEAQFYTEDGSESLPWSHAFWSIGNRKQSFVPEQSAVTRVTSGRTDLPSFELYATKGSLMDDEIAVGPEALDGPDVWIEPKLSDCIFFSDRFARLMREHGMLHLFDLKSVRQISPD